MYRDPQQLGANDGIMFPPLKNGTAEVHSLASSRPPRLLQSSANFVKGFRPPCYLIDGMIQRGYCYSLTARTGHGKTAVALYIAQCIPRGLKVHGREVRKGAVLFCAGENPDDIRARFLLLADRMGFDPADVDIHFIDGVINIEDSFGRIRREAESIPDLAFVIVDTAAAYFPGDDSNSNTQQGEFARLLRKLTIDLPTKPAVLVCCHPVKNAAKDNLAPDGRQRVPQRGGQQLDLVEGRWGHD